MIDKPREIALKTLYQIEKEGAYANLALNERIKESKAKLNPKDISFISVLVYGTTTWRLTLDEIIKKYSKMKLKKISVWIINILRMGVYQIVFLDKVPKAAAVNESVNLAKRYGHKSSSNFVNAILRKVEKSDYEALFAIQDITQRIAKTQSMPIWLIEKLLQQKSRQEVEEIAKNSNIIPKVSIRVNHLKTDKKSLQDRLFAQGIDTRDGWLTDFLIVEQIKDIENKEEFKQGLFTVQDEVAGLSSLVLNPKPSEIVLDACSSPGGKTTYLAQIMQNKGEIFAFDLHLHRVKLVEEHCKRLGISIVKTQQKDATKLDTALIEKFDKILLDVPCSGLGVLKRKPDIKWSKTEEEIPRIVAMQTQILQTCSNYLKKGGELVYSTCSILEEENTQVIENFIKQNKNFTITQIQLPKKCEFNRYLENNMFLKVYPNEETDGFFIAKLTKK